MSSQASHVMVVVEGVENLHGSGMEPDGCRLQQVRVEGRCIQGEVMGFCYFQDSPEVRRDFCHVYVPGLQEEVYPRLIWGCGGLAGKVG